MEEGVVIDHTILKVDSFLNHQLDISLLEEIGKEFYTYFKEKKITKIITIETSGIAFAVFVATYFGHIPVVFARKQESKINNKDCYSSKVYSFTKDKEYEVRIDKRFINAEDHVLFIDDFLANGQAILGLLEIAKQANATVEGVGIVIEKSFQNGRKRIEEKEVDLYSLARIKGFVNGKVVFVEE